MTPYLLSGAAGLLTALSPCVLPALPFMVGSAAQRHRLAPLALAAGMVIAFTVLGAALAAVGQAVDPAWFRYGAAALMLAAGLLMVNHRLHALFARRMSGMASGANSSMDTLQRKGLFGQCAAGALLGAVWSPCVGPTLGAATGLAAQSGGLAPATVMMFLFGIGAAVPLLVVAYGSRRWFMARRDRLIRVGEQSRIWLGWVMLGVGCLVLSGLDKILEAALLTVIPDAWINLITSI